MRRYGYICIYFERNSQVKKEFFRVTATKNKRGRKDSIRAPTPNKAFQSGASPGRGDGANALGMRLLMDHVRCTMDHVGNLASFAREVAKQEQGEFLNRCGLGSGKVLDKLSRLAGFEQFF